MDFSQLMKQAKNNQVLVERKHERHKQQKFDKQRFEKAKGEIERRKMAVRLKEFKATTERQRMEYKGLVGNGSVTTATQGRADPSPTSAPTPKVPRAGSKGKTGSGSTGTTGLSSSSTSGKAKSKRAPQTPSAKVSEVKPNRTAEAKPKPKKAAVMGFDDLLKIAKDKQSEMEGRERGSSLLRAPLHGDRLPGKAEQALSVTRPLRGSASLGKALLERTNPRVKLKRANEMTDGREGSPSGLQDARGDPTHPRAEPTNDEQVLTKSSSSRDIKVPVKAQVNGAVRERPPAPSPSTPPRTINPIQRPKPKRPVTQARTQPVKTKSFYGNLPPSARLIKDSSGRGMGGAAMKYTSTWVHEMSDFVRQGMHEEGYTDEEEEDDLADFMASDDEGGVQDDFEVSSEIRRIFGYDRRKYVGERDETSAMESSYAQQMYEEQRSARIGRQEDDDELRLEREGQVKRRKVDGGAGRKAPSGSHLVQSKLKFK